MEERFNLFALLISRINKSIKKIKSKEAERLNLKTVHVTCLYNLYKKKYLTSKELAVLCDEDKSSISRTLEYLENAGYVMQDKQSVGKYKNHFLLTRSGRKIANRLAEKIDNALSDAGAGLSDSAKSVIYDGLGVVSSNLNEICKEMNK